MVRLKVVRVLCNRTSKALDSGGSIAICEFIQPAKREFFGGGSFRLIHDIL
jgi:hypothetical protein